MCHHRVSDAVVPWDLTVNFIQNYVPLLWCTGYRFCKSVPNTIPYQWHQRCFNSKFQGHFASFHTRSLLSHFAPRHCYFSIVKSRTPGTPSSVEGEVVQHYDARPELRKSGTNHNKRVKGLGVSHQRRRQDKPEMQLYCCPRNLRLHLLLVLLFTPFHPTTAPWSRNK